MIYARLVDDEYNSENYLKIKKLYDYKKTPYQELMVCEVCMHGKVLFIDNRIQSDQHTQERYHRDLVLKITPDPLMNKALVIGAGEGITTDLLLKQGYNVTAIDIDKELIEMARKHLSDWNNKIYDRTDEFELIIDDALNYLSNCKDNSFDYVVFDLTEPENASEAAYTEKFIDDIHKVLKPGGCFSFQNGGITQEPIIENLTRKVFKSDPIVIDSGTWRMGHIIKE